MARWFGPKVVGFGVGPKGWQGWAATVLLLVVLVSIRYVDFAGLGLPPWTKAAAILSVLACYLIVVYFKYEGD